MDGRMMSFNFFRQKPFDSIVWSSNTLNITYSELQLKKLQKDARVLHLQWIDLSTVRMTCLGRVQYSISVKCGEKTL